MSSDALHERLKALPLNPGVYIFKDCRSRVIYVGKASRLRNRVRSYFGSTTRTTPKVAQLVEHIADFEFFVTSTNEDALVLELNLIKKFRPRYNISLKDDKTFPYLKIDPADGFARVYITRRVLEDKARYFGPFASAGSVRMILDVIKKMFPFRSCTKPIDGKAVRPCLDFHIKRCLGPCTGAVGKEEYSQMVRRISMFLEGRLDEVLQEMRRSMDRASEEMQFETAALLRDQIRAVERVIQEQKMATTVKGDQDVIAFALAGDRTTVEVFFIRNGKLIGREKFSLEGTRGEKPARIMSVFVKQFYSSSANIPPTILLQYQVEDASTIEGWLGNKRGSRVHLVAPSRGARKKLVDTVAENARQEQEQRRIEEMGATNVFEALDELSKALGLAGTCQRIECYDISNTGGTNTVGSMVVFENGRPAREHYRRFRIKTVTGADDYASLSEVIGRRFRPRSGSDEDRSWATLPDLVLIDGGKGQLGVAAKVMVHAGLERIALAGIAKEHEEVFVVGNPLPLDMQAGSAALRLLQRIRDEAHRFAISYHRDVRSRVSRLSLLDTVPGIGPKRRRALLKKFGSARDISSASLEEIASVPGMTRPLAKKVRQYLQSLSA
ncbi:MAG: excinuclease ABC subunit UvrC [Chloroflexi bacterium]|nr:excinuclease ABC subunit UvrC [Chloroflexota bacterium]